VADEGRWRVVLLPEAQAGLLAIQKERGESAAVEALNDILALGEDPMPEDAENLRKTRGHYRIYVGRSLYRAIYRVSTARRTVLVERVGPRGSVYLRGGFERW
jgi:mRNA-degrading endonuclease RelE of RelBE toxin-antitoxin system